MPDNGLILLGATSVVAVILYIWTALGLAAVFRKAGEAPGKAWVPFLNAAVVLRLGGFSGWLVLILLVPLFGGLLLYVSLIVAAHNINRSFGLGGGMTVLSALLFPVWASVLGFGSARWLPADDGWGPVRSNETVALPFALDDPRRERTSSLLDGPRPYPGDGLTVMPLPPEPAVGDVPARPAWLDEPAVPAAAGAEPTSAVSEVSSWFRPGEEEENPLSSGASADPFGLAAAPRPAAPVPGILRSPEPYAGFEDDAFPEASGAVSAVIDAPRPVPPVRRGSRSRRSRSRRSRTSPSRMRRSWHAAVGSNGPFTPPVGPPSPSRPSVSSSDAGPSPTLCSRMPNSSRSPTPRAPSPRRTRSCTGGARRGS